ERRADIGVAEELRDLLPVQATGDHVAGRAVPRLVRGQRFRPRRLPRLACAGTNRGGIERICCRAAEEELLPVATGLELVSPADAPQLAHHRHVPLAGERLR